MFVFLRWSPNVQHGAIWKWGPWEANSVTRGHGSRPPLGLVSLQEEGQTWGLSPHCPTTQWQGCRVPARQRALTRNCLPHLDGGCRGPQNCENVCLWVVPPGEPCLITAAHAVHSGAQPCPLSPRKALVSGDPLLKGKSWAARPQPHGCHRPAKEMKSPSPLWASVFYLWWQI